MKQLLKSRKFYGAVALVLILVVAGTIIWQGRTASDPEAAAEATTYTATVEEGDIILSAAGTGELITSREINFKLPRGWHCRFRQRPGRAVRGRRR